jgi:hypothetical protein
VTVDIVDDLIHTWPCWHARCQLNTGATIQPFAALRFSSDEPLDDVTAPPFDVLSPADVDTLVDGTTTASSASMCHWIATGRSL